ncbi:MAG: threonine/serine dehydratase [Chloroflexi bacterium]|nr:threonine/serine dehydratase [Chloroflexota bacterium]
MTDPVTAQSIAEAQARIAPYLTPTPLEHAPKLGAVWLKLENVNPTHSFKVRGALNAMLRLKESGAATPEVIAASSGNHAQALAYAARLTGVKATILMPSHTPRKKVDGVRLHGGEGVLFGTNYDAAEAEAIRRSKEEEIPYISPYNDADIVSGAGTCGQELLAQLPEMARVLVPASGGGLLTGIAVAIKSARPDCEVIGVCAAHAPAMHNVKHGTALPQVWDTLAEALSGDIEVGAITVGLAHKYVDRVVLVTEEQIAEAMRWMLSEQGWLIEGGGAVTVAALRSGTVADDGRPTVCVVSGSNLDLETVKRIVAD